MDLASDHYDRLNRGDVDPNSLPETHWTPLEMFCLSQRLKSPLPPINGGSDCQRYDFTHVADWACTMKKLKLQVIYHINFHICGFFMQDVIIYNRVTEENWEPAMSFQIV